MAKLYVDTIEPEGATTNLAIGESGQDVIVTGNDIRANVLQDAGGNAIFTSDGSGNVTGVNAGFGGAMALINTATADDDASISFTSGFSSTYDHYIFKLYTIHPASATEINFRFQCSIDGGSNYNIEVQGNALYSQNRENDTSGQIAYASAQSPIASTNPIILGYLKGAETDRSFDGELHLFNVTSTTFVKNYMMRNQMMDGNTPAFSVWTGMGGYFNTTSAINAIQFTMSSGNVEKGTIKMLGVK